MVQFEVPPIVPADPQANVTDLLVERVKKTPDRALFAVPEGDGWRDISAAEFQRQVIALAKGFAAAGIEPGDKVGFIARTTYEWSLVDFGLFFAGAVMVPIYETNSPAQITWNLTDSGAVACITELPDHTARLDEARSELPLIRSTWSMHTGDLAKLVGAGQGCSGCRDRAPAEHRERVRHRDAHLHVRLDGTPEGLRAHPQQLRRALPQLGEGAERSRRGTRGVDPAVHHHRAHLRPLHLDPRDPRRREDRPPARHEEPAPGTRLVQADVPAGRSARVREGLQLGGAEGRGGRQGQDLPRGRPHRRRALQAAGGGQEDPPRHEDQVRAVRPARLQQAARSDGRPRRLRRLRIRTARTAARPLLPQPRRRHPRGLRPHRDDRSRDGQPGDASRRSAPSVRRSPASGSGWPRTARSKSAVSTCSRSTGTTPRRPRPPSTATGSRPATSARSTTRASSPSPAARRRSSSRRAGRTSRRPRSRTRSAPTRSSDRSSSSATSARSSRRW